MIQEPSPWMCHICGRTGITEEGATCEECFKISCKSHMTTVTSKNPQTGLYELVTICALCRFKRHL